MSCTQFNRTDTDNQKSRYFCRHGPEVLKQELDKPLQQSIVSFILYWESGPDLHSFLDKPIYILDIKGFLCFSKFYPNQIQCQCYPAPSVPVALKAMMEPPGRLWTLTSSRPIGCLLTILSSLTRALVNI